MLIIGAAATDNASTLEIMTAPGSPQKIASVPSMSGDAALLMKYEATVPLKKKHNTKVRTSSHSQYLHTAL